MMQNQVILLTGGIASGKTFVSNYLATFGANIIDTDIIAKNLLEKDATPFSADLIEEVVSIFGMDCLSSSGIIDRRKLKEAVFDNHEYKKELEALLHPLILEIVKNNIKINTRYYHVIVLPLLLENSEYLAISDQVLVIEVSESMQILRQVERDNIGQDLAVKIISSQMSNKERRKYANTIIINTNRDFTIQKLKQLHKRYTLL